MFRYTPRQIPSKIMVIGCGGTGSRLVPMLAQFMRSITREHNPRGWLDNPSIYLVDFDVVEQKNLLRQNFIERDINRNKAVVLAERYSRAFGVDIQSVTKRIEHNDSWGSVLNDTGIVGFNGRDTMYIMCVDSAAARRNILRLISSVTPQSIEQSPFIIDAGNENNYGQVKFFNSAVLYGDPEELKRFKFPEMLPIPCDIPIIPMPAKFYQELEDAPSQGSCADLDQTLAINAAMATTIMGVVQNFYYVKTFTHNEVSISLDGAGFTTFNTIANFRNRAVNTSPRSGYLFGEEIFQSYYNECNAVIRQEQIRLERLRAQEEALERKKKQQEEAARQLERDRLAELRAKEEMDRLSKDAVGEVEAEEVKAKRPSKSKSIAEAPALVQVTLPEPPPLERISRVTTLVDESQDEPTE